MPLSLRRGTVTVIGERREGIVRLEVDGVPCIAYPRLTGPVEVGDEVLVNVQARALGLGSGGFDVLHANLTRGLELDTEPDAHVMVLPYTPLQHSARHVEENGELADSLDGKPVVCCSLHSQVVPVCAALRGLRTAYVQLGGGALPVSLSDAVRALESQGLLELVVAASPCFDADAQAVNVYSALAWCAAQGVDAIVCAIGPGIVGTGSAFGHGGVAAAEAANAASALGGHPIIAPRMSGADSRERHLGLSHHTQSVLAFALDQVSLPAPQHFTGADWREACRGLPLSHMGRGADEDPEFFAAAFAAGRLARSLVT